jgi:LPPG:FO 2-phospho-L-lactate transferase
MDGGVTLLSGGVGGAKLALGLSRVVEPERLTVIANSGDDLTLFGLRICPDSDILAYTLASQVDEGQGWGVRGDTFQALERVRDLGGTGWFNLGDTDIGLHLFRTELLAQGVGLAEITLQEYLVERRAEPPVSAIRFEGVEKARPAPGVAEAIAASGIVIVAPSNPLISIAPILAVPGLRDLLRESGARKVAVSPVVGGKCLKGPTDKMLAELGHPVSPPAVAELYRDFLDVFVVDEQDRPCLAEVAGMGLQGVAAPTVMHDLAAKTALARYVLAAGGAE